ncbi:MAG: hypothetical protein II782_00505, partial [Oscillospiraceae bacterium]|nr:hypothetical protein [Oscillospiraceae bacterium]
MAEVRKTLKQRVLAFITAVATSLTLTLPGIAPTVSAASQGYTVNIDLYDRKSQVLEDPESTIQGPFYVVAVAKAYDDKDPNLSQRNT